MVAPVTGTERREQGAGVGIGQERTRSAQAIVLRELLCVCSAGDGTQGVMLALCH